MSVIQNIRNKYIGLVVGLIVLALIGFLVMDAMQSNVRSIFSGDNTLLASVNGNRIEYKAFEALRQQYEENAKQRHNERMRCIRYNFRQMKSCRAYPLANCPSQLAQ